MKKITRGDIFYADLGNGQGSEQSGYRPVLIIQNDLGNKYSPTVIIAPITKALKKELPTHVSFNWKDIMKNDSCILLEQIRVIDKSRLSEFIRTLDKSTMDKVDDAIMNSVGIINKSNVPNSKLQTIFLK